MKRFIKNDEWPISIGYKTTIPFSCGLLQRTIARGAELMWSLKAHSSICSFKELAWENCKTLYLRSYWVAEMPNTYQLLSSRYQTTCYLGHGQEDPVLVGRVACSLVTIDLKSGRDSSSKNCKDINNREKRLFSFISCCIMVQAGDHYNRTINSDMPPALSLVFRMITSECDSLQWLQKILESVCVW